VIEDHVDRYRDTVVAVTGSSGYLASALIPGLQRVAARVIAVSRGDRDRMIGVDTCKADVRLRATWTDIVGRADIIFHLAGNTSVSGAARDPGGSLQSTVVPLIHLAAAAREAGRCPRVVYASTATVYGLTVDLPVGEDAEVNPITVYDLHKRAAEMHLQLATRQGGVNGVSLRLANVYGPSSGIGSAVERGVLNKMAEHAMRGADLQVFGDGNYLRDYVYIDDVIRALVIVGAQTGGGGRSFNVGSGSGVTVRDAFQLVAERAARITGTRSAVCHSPWPDHIDPIELRQFTANVERMASAFGWRPAVSLVDGIDALVAHLATTSAVPESRGDGR
jgi:nucleoside-diphosphate-sugar epimerase